MTRVSALILGACVLACGAADSAELFDAAGDLDSPEPVQVAQSSTRQPTPRAAPAAPAAAPPAAPVEPPPDPWRTCLNEDACELKASACLPLIEDGTRYCRRLRATLDEECDAHEDCELGLECRRFDTTAARHCLPVQGTPAADRWPLSCEGGVRIIDAHCEPK